MLKIKTPALTVLIFALLASAVAFTHCITLIYFAVGLFLAAAFVAAIKNKATVFISLLVGCIVLAQSITIQFGAINKIAFYDAKNVEICGTVCKSPKAAETYVSQIIKVSSINNTKLFVPVKIELISTNGFVTDQGDKVRVVAEIEQSKGTRFQNGDFAQGIYATAKKFTLKSVEKDNNIYTLSGKVKGFVKSTFENYMPYEEATVLTAIVVGDQENIDGNFSKDVIDSGVSHMLVVSGMHLTIICAMLIKLLKKFVAVRFSALLVLPFVLFIAATCDFGYSIIRAAISYAIYLVGCMLLKRSDPLSSLCIAVVAILICNPYALASVSLLLSASATAGIITVSEPMYNKISLKICKGKFKFLKYIVEPFCTTFGATLFCLPILMLVFGRISIVSLIVNLLVSYSVTFALIAAVAALVIAAIFKIEPIINLLLGASTLLIKYFCAVVRFAAKFEFSSVDVTKPFAIIFTVLLVSFAVLGLGLIKRGKKKLFVKIVAVAAVPFVLLSVYFNTGKFDITAVELNKSQCVIISKGNSAVVIGAGSSLYEGNLINTAIKNLEVDTIDALYIINSRDSFAGAKTVLQKNDIKAVYTAQNESVREQIKELCKKTEALPSSHSLSSGIKLQFFESTVYIQTDNYNIFVGDNNEKTPLENYCYNNSSAHIFTNDDGVQLKTKRKTYVTDTNTIRAKVKDDYILILK